MVFALSRSSDSIQEASRPQESMSAAHARLTIIKKNGNLGGVCPMEDSQLIIGRRAPLQHSHPAPLAHSLRARTQR